MKLSSFLICILIAVGCRQPAPAQTPSAANLADPAQGVINAVTTVLADESEAGERMEFSGRILDYRGEPLSEAAVVAYQTDATGVYNRPDAGTRVPRLRAVAITDEDGGFRFSTIRPGPYPGRGNPQHIHLEITSPSHRLKWVTYWFNDDPTLTPELRNNLDDETVIVALSADADGTWTFSNDIRLEGN